MKRQDLKKVWDEMELSCRCSYSVQTMKDFYKRLGLDFPKELIYTKDRYREQSNGEPRIDAKDVLIDVCKKFGIEPDRSRLELANKMFGEGSRRKCIEEAYLLLPLKAQQTQRR